MIMIPTYRYSVSSSSSIPIDLNEDHTHHHHHHHFSTNHQASASSSSSLSYSFLFNPDQDQGGSFHWESNHLQSDEEAEKIVPSKSGSWDDPVAKKDENRSDLKLRIWKKEDGCENLQGGDDSSTKCMPSKMRIRRRMMVSDDEMASYDIAGVSNSKQIKYEEKNHPPLSPLGTDDSNYNSSSNHRNIITVRVCSDCHTTKTPLWRSGPEGPKSLCNACGIRQRKARRAIAAAAATANGSNNNLVEAAEKSQVKKKKGNKLHSKRMKKSKTTTEGAAPQMKKKRKLGGDNKKYRKSRFGAFEDLTVRLSKNLALQQVFPQDEKEAAILLMALSHGLLHGFPTDRYITN